MKTSNRAILLMLGEVLSAAQLISNSVSGMMPARTRSFVNVRLERNPEAKKSLPQFTQEIIDYCTENRFHLDRSILLNPELISALLGLGNRLGFRAFAANPNLLLVDVSWPVIREYATAVAGNICDKRKRDALAALLNTCSAYDAPAQASDRADYRRSKLSEYPAAIKELTADLCNGNNRLFNLEGLPPPYAELFKDRLGEMCSNWTGWQRVMTMRILQILNNTEYAFIPGKDGPIQILKIPNETRISRQEDIARLLRGQGSSGEGRVCSHCNSENLSVVLSEEYLERPTSVVFHELTHASHYMMMPDIESVQLPFVQAVLQDKFYRCLFFPQLKEERMCVIVRSIQGNISRDYVQNMIGKMNDDTNNDPDKRGLCGIFRLLIVNGFASIVFGDQPQASKKIPDILTPELIARTIYVYCAFFRDPVEKLLTSYDEKAKFTWHSCEEIFTILGMVPVYFDPSGRTVALLDRQSEFVYKLREKASDVYYSSEKEAQVYNHHSHLWSGDPKWFSASIGAVLSSIGVGLPSQSFHTSLLSFLFPWLKSPTVPCKGGDAYPRDLVYADDSQPGPVRLDKLPNDWIVSFFDSEKDELRRELGNGAHIPASKHLEPFLRALAVEKIFTQESLKEIIRIIATEPRYVGMLLWKLDSLLNTGMTPSMIATIVQRMPDMGQWVDVAQVPNIHVIVSAVKANQASIDGYDREEYSVHLANIQRYFVNPALLHEVAKTKPIVQRAVTFLAKSAEIIARHGLTHADPETTTPLHVAVEQGCVGAVKEIVHWANTYNVGINTIATVLGGLSSSPLGLAVMLDNAEIVSELLENKRVDCNSPTGSSEVYNNTPLFFVKSTAIAKLLIQKGAPIDHRNAVQRTPLFLAAQLAKETGVVEALVNARADVNAKENHGLTPLHFAQTAEVVHVLVNAGAGVNAIDNDCKTPLHFARTPEVVRALVNAGAGVNAKDNDGKTPLFYAPTPEVVQVLVNAGAGVNAIDDYGKTPLHYAKRAAVAQALLDKGARVNTASKDGKTPLFYAPTPEVVLALVNAGAGVNAKDNDVKTPLHFARTPEVVRALVNARADVNAIDKYGKTPLDLATNRSVIAELQKLGAKRQ
ncbi:MAG: ankyrin repeat domain-containing protein [Holosporaceae bacterium]|nr:ankyrin repeat domain-containing protein [Holosporaceae bacterium]